MSGKERVIGAATELLGATSKYDRSAIAAAIAAYDIL
jgi:hypothetical protein